MAFRHASVTVTTTPKDLLAGAPDISGYQDVARSVLLTNEGDVTVFIGGPAVTSTNYGYTLPAAGVISFDLKNDDVPYGVVASGTAIVRALHAGV